MKSPHPSTTIPGLTWELRDWLLLGGLGLFAVLSLIVWATGRAAGTLFGSGVPRTGLAGMAQVLMRLPAHLNDPHQAWPPADQFVLPGPAGWYAAFVLVLLLTALVLGLPAVAIYRVWKRSRTRPAARPLAVEKSDPRHRDVAEPEWSEGFAIKQDLERLYVPRPQPGRITLGYAYRRLVAAEVEHSVLVVGATRSGKTTGVAIPNLVEWDGPAVVLSAKTDLVHATHEERSERGPSWVFDPTGVSGLPSTGWSPLGEAISWSGAVRIANAMSKLSGTTDGLGGSNHWQRVAAQLLAPLLHAAALSGHDMGAVLSWVKTQKVGPAMAALVRTENKVAAESLQSTLDTEQRQRDSAFNTVRTVLDAYEDPDVLATSVQSDLGADQLLDGGSGTLYLVANASDQTRLSPLFLGLLDQLMRAAFRQAAENRAKHGAPVPSGRRRLLLLLDEAANIAPLPDLATLASTAGGEGVQLLTIFQDLSQLRHRYATEWGSIASNHVTKLLLPGVGDPETLRYFSQLSGDVQRMEESVTTGEGRSSRTRSTRRSPLQGEAQLRALAPRTGRLWSSSLPPAMLALLPPPRASSPVTTAVSRRARSG